MSEVIERSCKGCGDWALCFDGYCGDCAPASAVQAYVDWWGLPAAAVARVIGAEQVLSELALELGEQVDRESDDAGG